MNALIARLRQGLVKCHRAFNLLKPSLIAYRGNTPLNTKWALISYVKDAINLKDGDPRLLGHSNFWECREIAQILSRLGYNVEAMSYDDPATVPSRRYDLVLDIDANLYRLAVNQDKTCVMILLVTGSHHAWAAESELRRVADFEKTHNAIYLPRMIQPSPYVLNRSLQLADACLLIGNQTTQATFPPEFQTKLRRIPVTGSHTTHVKAYGRRSGGYLFFSSPRCVLKGLDLVLDSFIRHSERKLHVVGDFRSEPDFFAAYPDLPRRDNIVFHGFLQPSSARLAEIVDACDAFVFPSCSEGMSTSCITCLQLGLFPIITEHACIDLPERCGIWIADYTEAAVSSALDAFEAKPLDAVAGEAESCRAFTAARFNRSEYTRVVTAEIQRAIAAKRGGEPLAEVR